MTLTDIKINSYISEERYKQDLDRTYVVCLRGRLIYVNIIDITSKDNAIEIFIDNPLLEINKSDMENILINYFVDLAGDA